MVNAYADVLVHPGEQTQDICLKYLAGLPCSKIAAEVGVDIVVVYISLSWLDDVAQVHRQVRPDEWETVE